VQPGRILIIICCLLVFFFNRVRTDSYRFTVPLFVLLSPVHTHVLLQLFINQLPTVCDITPAESPDGHRPPDDVVLLLVVKRRHLQVLKEFLLIYKCAGKIGNDNKISKSSHKTGAGKRHIRTKAKVKIFLYIN